MKNNFQYLYTFEISKPNASDKQSESIRNENNMGTNDSSSYQDERIAIKKPVMHIILKTQSSTEGQLLP